MIKTIELDNFQAHKRTSLSLHPGVNVIKGPSHNGKTAIIRALKWALTNKPGGEAFKSWFAGKKDKVSVAIEFDDGYIIRNKQGTKNGYKLKHNGEEAVELNAIGKELPQEVSIVSRMTELNLQSQHDPYFMLQDSAGIALQKLNQIVGLTIIDETLKSANQKNHKLLSELRTTEASIDEIDVEVKSLDYLDFAGKVIDRIIEDRKELKRVQDEGVALNTVLRSVEYAEEEIEECDQILSLEEDYKEIQMIVRYLRSIQYQRSDLVSVLSDAAFHGRKIEECSHILQSEAATLRLIETAKKIQKIRSERVSLQRTCESIRNLRKSINDASEELIQAQMKYEQTLVDAGICPLCGQKIKNGGLHDHESENNQSSSESKS